MGCREGRRRAWDGVRPSRQSAVTTRKGKAGKRRPERGVTSQRVRNFLELKQKNELKII
jgi:hypothetical protein